jgi:hypothetical protein
MFRELAWKLPAMAASLSGSESETGSEDDEEDEDDEEK